MPELIYYTKQIFDFYSVHEFIKFFQAGFGGEPCLIDRTDTINELNNKKVKSLYPFKTIEEENRTLSDLIDIRANEIISKNKITDVFWSGGIDSTTVLISLLKNSSEEWKKSYLRIILNERSIYENNHLYQKILKYNIINYNSLPFILHEYNKTYKDELVVTGEMADQITGNHFSCLYSNTAKRNYKTILNVYKKLNTKFNDSPLVHYKFDYNAIVEQCEILSDKSPIKIESLYDLLTWINFSLTWDYNCNRYLSEKIKLHNLYNFFNTDYFQNWAIINHEEKKKDAFNGIYKKHFRNYINDYLKDDYAYTMKKQTSPSTSSNMILSKKNIIAIDTNYNFYYDTKIDRLKVKENFKIEE